MKSGDVKMAATLFVLMGEETAAEVLRHLNEAEIEAISREISTVGPIASEEAEKSAEELYGLLMANRFVSEGVHEDVVVQNHDSKEQRVRREGFAHGPEPIAEP